MSRCILWFRVLFVWIPFHAPLDARSTEREFLLKGCQAVVSLYVQKKARRLTSSPLESPLFPDHFPETDADQSPETPDVLMEPSGIALGSGVLLTPEGLVVTSAHLIQNATKITIVTQQGMEGEGLVLRTDPDHDLALLRFSPAQQPKTSLTVLPLATLPPALGEPVWGIANTHGLPQSLSRGIIAAPQRKLPTSAVPLIQTDMLIGPGSSGGALINTKGELLGIITAVFSPPKSASQIAFVVGAPYVKKLLKEFQ